MRNADSAIFEAADQFRSKKDHRFIWTKCRSKAHNFNGTMQLAEFRKPADSDDEECSEVEAPLSQRALALQERVLSPRILWYDGNRRRGYCRQSQCSEELPLLPPEG